MYVVYMCQDAVNVIIYKDACWCAYLNGENVKNLLGVERAHMYLRERHIRGTNKYGEGCARGNTWCLLAYAVSYIMYYYITIYMLCAILYILGHDHFINIAPSIYPYISRLKSIDDFASHIQTPLWHFSMGIYMYIIYPYIYFFTSVPV